LSTVVSRDFQDEIPHFDITLLEQGLIYSVYHVVQLARVMSCSLLPCNLRFLSCFHDRHYDNDLFSLPFSSHRAIIDHGNP
jgi:lysophospholipid acyltransferase (LPLAT)-like uncharacterized protein